MMFRSDVGTLRQRIEFSGSLYSVGNNAGIKLIAITNCKDLNHFLVCGNFANLCCQGYLYFGSREKYFIVSNGMLIH